MRNSAKYIGAIVGDINGSKYEFNNIHQKGFELFQDEMHMTDDSLLTLAVMKALVSAGEGMERSKEWETKYKRCLTKEFLKMFFENRPGAGFGGRFSEWCTWSLQEPYNSFGNGSAMRTSPIAYVARNLEECLWLAELTAGVTHNHPEGIKGGQATSVAIYLALHGATKEEIKEKISKDFYPELAEMSYNSIKKNFRFNETCQGTVPQAITVFLESVNYEDCIRSAVALGGDCDTVAAIACSIASAYYEDNLVPLSKIDKCLTNNDRETICRFIEMIERIHENNN